MVLLDDHPSAPHGVVALLRARAGFEILLATAEIHEALRQVRDTRPDLVLLNLRVVGDELRALAGALQGDAAQSPVIIMGLTPHHVDVMGLVQAGVSGFVMANASMGRFLATIRGVMRGRRVLPAELTSTLFAQLNEDGIRKRPKLTVKSRLEVAAFSRRIQPLERLAPAPLPATLIP